MDEGGFFHGLRQQAIFLTLGQQVFRGVNVHRKPGSVFLRQPDALVVDQAGVLDRIHPRLDGVADTFRAVGVNGDGHVVIVGRSNIVGKPMASLLLNAEATVTITHIYTKDLKAHTSKADIVVVGVGVPGLIKEDMVKEGAIVIDIGINRIEDGSLVGDVDFKNVSPKCSYITPVPGGVGPMTIAMLLSNTLKSAKARAKA